MMSLGLPPALPAWVSGIAQFQDLGFFSKALLDAGGIDVPYALNAKNKEERDERIVQGVLIMTFAYGIAPLHSYLLARHFLKAVPTPRLEDRQALFRFSYTQLENVHTFSEHLKTQLPHLKPLNASALDALRKHVLKVKTSHLIVDLALEGAFLSSIPFLKNLVTALKTGETHFTGEHTLAKKEDLNALYQNEQKQDGHKNILGQALATMALSALLPTLLTFTLRKAVMAPSTKTKGLLHHVKSWAPHFDYQYMTRWKWFKQVPLLPVMALLPVFIGFNLGRLSSARSKRERNEALIQDPLFLASFFGVTPLVFRLLNKGFPTINKRLEHLIQNKASTAEIQKTALFSAGSFLFAYALNILATIGVVQFTNDLTRKGIAEEIKALHEKDNPFKPPTPTPSPHS